MAESDELHNVHSIFMFPSVARVNLSQFMVLRRLA